MITRSFNHIPTNSNVQASTVEFVSNRKYLNLDTEHLLFSEIVNWSLAESRRRNLNTDDWISMRSILIENSIFKAIRFLAMKPEEIAKAIAKSSNMVEVSTSSKPISSNTASNISNGMMGEEGRGEEGSGDESAPSFSFRIDPSDSNSLLNEAEQRAILLNLALQNIAKLPATINPSPYTRQAPPEYFTLKRFKSSSGGGGGVNLPSTTLTTTTTRSIKSITSKFQCLSENVFIVALTIPIRLDVSSYSNRKPKFECHLKFTTKATTQPISSGTFTPLMAETGNQQQDSSICNLDGSALLMDTIDESLHISIARDKDCLVRLKRPILIRMGNLNELNLTFQTYALDEDIVALRTPKSRSATFSEQTDAENISWLFFKTSNIEFSELHYYY